MDLHELKSLNELSIEDLDSELASIEEYNLKVDNFRTYEGSDKVYKYDELKRLYSAKPKKQSIRSKISRLDDVVDGFQSGELIIISGRTGEGKTTFAQSLIFDFAENNDTSLLLSYEVGTADILDRFGVPTLNLALTDEVKSYDLKWLEDKIWEGIAKYEIKAVFVDHLHYLVDMAQMYGNASLVIGKVVRELKQMAIRTKMPIFLISHLTKVATDTEPTVNDLRDSSFIGQEADMVLIIWRTSGNDGILSVAKNRRKGTKIAFPISLVAGRFVQC